MHFGLAVLLSKLTKQVKSPQKEVDVSPNVTMSPVTLELKDLKL